VPSSNDERRAAIADEGLRAELLKAEAQGREGSAAIATAAAAADRATTALVRHAYRIGCVQRLLAIGRDSVVADQADEGMRYAMAEIAIDLAAARELVWTVAPGDTFRAALAGVAVRDALTAALASSVSLTDDSVWEEFQGLRAELEVDLRVDRSGSGDLEAVADALLSGSSALGGKG
jgi:hypothetical protein